MIVQVSAPRVNLRPEGQMVEVLSGRRSFGVFLDGHKELCHWYEYAAGDWELPGEFPFLSAEVLGPEYPVIGHWLGVEGGEKLKFYAPRRRWYRGVWETKRRTPIACIEAEPDSPVRGARADSFRIRLIDSSSLPLIRVLAEAYEERMPDFKVPVQIIV